MFIVGEVIIEGNCFVIVVNNGLVYFVKVGVDILYLVVIVCC